MCGNSRQQLADTKDALVRGITTLETDTSRTRRCVYVEDVWCAIILINNSLITKMFWSVVSRPFNRHDNKHVEASGPRTSTIRCFARLWWCGDVAVFLWWWCGGVNIQPENSHFSVFCTFVVVWWFGAVWHVYMLNKDVLVRGITTLSETSGPRTDVEFSC